MDYLKSFPALEGLVELANRDDVDIGPTLLRVLTDLYVTKPRHTREEERQYTELVLRLIDEVDISARHRLSQRLATYAAAPAAVVRRLARDVIAVAEPILTQSRAIGGAELLAIARDAGAAHVAALATRDDIKAPRKQCAEPSAALFAGRVAAASELNALFYSANAIERRLILLHLDYAPFAPARPVHAAIAHEAVRRLELAALSHNVESFIRELARPLAISPAQARCIAHDAGGEPIAVAGKALGMVPAVLQRILLSLNPAISRSVQRVYDLSDLYEALKPTAALRMLAIWQAIAYKPQAAAHQPQFVEDKTQPRPEPAAARRRSAVPNVPDRRTGARKA